jgi:hypothetical protein
MAGIFRRRVSYQFGIIAEGEPGEVVEIETAPLAADKSWFKVDKILVGTADKIGGALFCCLRELRSDSPGLANPRVSIEDTTIVVDDDGTVARLRVPFGIQKGESLKATIKIPPTGKLFCTLVGPAEEAEAKQSEADTLFHIAVDKDVIDDLASSLINATMLGIGAKIGKRAVEARDARACPKCGAAVGEWCKRDSSDNPGWKSIHRERL